MSNPTNKYGFWLVWNPEGRAPTKRHGTKVSAEQEASRLAEKEPGRSFYVMQADQVFRGVTSVVTTMDFCTYPGKSGGSSDWEIWL